MAYFSDDHTGEMIARGFVEALTSSGLSEDRQACITTDSVANDPNRVKAASLNKWTRLQCFGHQLHLSIGKLLTQAFARNNYLW